MIVHYVLSFQNHMILQEIIIMSSSYIVKDINLAGFGKKEIVYVEKVLGGNKNQIVRTDGLMTMLSAKYRF